ncbi:uncharacterized protein EV154DRAFT_46622 [Mucor mucedo]|uniref:uncharacterized protein n=1 Tax=Mucor mucedo TaxID=29922 RepID=UPI0022201ABB|nr:uncharacterized protein EV154DRAFT_46622 [Mucor mucedo]KAI7880285.1 hypothetical protein EV154DRAFT_46622 [Mucor mucedo]
MLSSPKNINAFPRRVSFDLSHNIVHLLPTLEECRDAAKQKSREEWQRKSLNEDMLSEDIIIEIQEDCSASSRHTDSSSDEEQAAAEHPTLEPKSCLKKPPVVIATPVTISKRSKKNQKKRKRANSHVTNVVSVH